MQCGGRLWQSSIDAYKNAYLSAELELFGVQKTWTP